LFSSALMKTFIVGYGNPLRGDDGVGWRVVEEIVNRQWSIDNGQLAEAHSETPSPKSEIRNPKLIAVHQLLPELAEPISEAELVIFVDASVEGEPGVVRTQTVAPRPQPMGAFTHHFDPAGLLAYAAEVYGRCPRAYLVTVTAVSLGYAETLSATVEAALPEVLRQIQLLVQ
jgi:hydrogenase maturation protease